MNNLVNNYGWNNSSGPESCGYIGPKILKILNNLNITRVCDLGSGNGVLAGELKVAGFDVVGIEYDKKGVEIASKKYPDIKFYNFGVQDDPVQVIAKEELFDVVVSTEVVEHLFSPHLLPIFSKKILRNGGYLVVSTPYHGYLKNMALSIFNKWDKHHTPLWHGGHIKFWSKKTLSQLLELNGFKVLKYYGVGRLPWLWKSMIIVAKVV